MSGRITPSYDLVSFLLRFGQHRRWKCLATAIHVVRVARQRGPTAQRALDPIERS
jgi:ubiquinone/menaquinone biosynthesis C-methylase UbiE